MGTRGCIYPCACAVPSLPHARWPVCRDRSASPSLLPSARSHTNLSFLSQEPPLASIVSLLSALHQCWALFVNRESVYPGLKHSLSTSAAFADFGMPTRRCIKMDDFAQADNLIDRVVIETYHYCTASRGVRLLLPRYDQVNCEPTHPKE
jgi:hypothetical protein